MDKALFDTTDPVLFFQLQMAALRSGAALNVNTPGEVPGAMAMHDDTPDTVAASFAQTPPEQIAITFHTSGSTGTPKPVPHAWGQLMGEARNVAGSVGLTQEPRLTTITTVPLDHMFGYAFGFVLTNLMGFERPLKRFVAPKSLLRALKAARHPVLLITTPTHLKAYAASDIANFPNVAWIFCATSPLPSELAAPVQAKFGVPIIDIYGCTEGGVLAWRRMSAPDPDWTCLDGTTVTAMDGGYLFETAYFEAPVQIDDRLELTGPKTFRFLGRSNDMVKIGGKRQSLWGLARLVESLPNVREAAFFLPEGNTNARLALFAAFDGPAEFDALRQIISAQADPVFVPRQCFAVERLPRSANGKLPVAALAALYEEKTNKAKREAQEC